MGIITRNYDFENGTTADAEQVDAEFNTIYNEFNGNIDGANIKSTIAGVKTFSDGIKTDTIDEETAGAGVTVDGINLKDNLDTSNIVSKSGNQTIAGVKTFSDVLHATAQPSACVYNSANQSIANGTNTLINFDKEVWDVGNCHDNVTNNTRLVAPCAGKYWCGANVEFAKNTTGFRMVRILKNGAFIAENRLSACSDTHVVNISVIADLAVNDYIEVTVYQNSGGALNVTAGLGQTQLQFIKLS